MTDNKTPRHAVLVQGIKNAITAKNEEQIGILAVELMGEFFDLQHRHTVALETVARELVKSNNPLHLCSHEPITVDLRGVEKVSGGAE